MSTNKHRAMLSKTHKEAGDVSTQQVEAARYAVLRRLSPALRHHMVRPLQPIGLIYSVMNHKLCEPTPDLQALRLQIEKINGFAKSALTECLDIGTWLAPEPGTLAELGSSVTECVGLLATTLHFCGFRLVNEVDTPPVNVNRDSLRMVLIAAIFEMIDGLSEPATLTLSASLGRGEASLLLRSTPLAEGRVERYDDGYRKVTWNDVQALANEGGVSASRQDNGVVMKFAIRAAASAFH